MGNRIAIGIDLGGTNLRAAKVSEEGRIIEKVKVSSSGDTVAEIYNSVQKLFSDNISGIGLASAGVIDRKRGCILVSPNLPVIEGIDLVSGLNRRFNVPVIMENDANAAAYGELLAGAGRGFSDFILFTLGTGIGGGIIYDGKPLTVSAEFGHMTVEANGNICPCGNYGCLEAYASAKAIVSAAVFSLKNGKSSILEETLAGDFSKLTPEDIYKAAVEGDMLSVEILKNAGRYLGIGIANIINIMSPEAVILAGGLAGAWDIYVREAVKEASSRAFKYLFERTKIIPAELMDDAGIIGAAGLVFQA